MIIDLNRVGLSQWGKKNKKIFEHVQGDVVYDRVYDGEFNVNR